MYFGVVHAHQVEGNTLKTLSKVTDVINHF